MSETILTTKLYLPPPQSGVVGRGRLDERLDEGLRCKLTLISAPAGFGKTTALSVWAAQSDWPVAWLSLDEGDRDPSRFLAYLISALQTVLGNVGQRMLSALQSPQRPSTEALLTALLNEISVVPDDFLLVLDDYHVVDSRSVDDALAFLIEHLPPQMHLVIATREDPRLPLARLRGRGQLTELRAADLRFTAAEASMFLAQTMGLDLSAADIAALDMRTEGWIVGLQLAAISMRGLDDTAGFIASFTGSHRFVLDYLVEEVLQRQPESVQSFLLRTSILDRLSGPLCDAMLRDTGGTGDEMLHVLERANLFIVPLDHDRRWYRYHHLFAELLRQRLQQADSAFDGRVAELHERASDWFEGQGLEIEAFQHAIAANDIERAERLIRGNGTPLFVRSSPAPVLAWFESLPKAVLDRRPSLWVMFASAVAVVGQFSRIEALLQGAEAAIDGLDPADRVRNDIGQIAAIRALAAVLAADPGQLETILVQSRRALEYLDRDNLTIRTSTIWRMGLAYQYQGDRAAALRAYRDAIEASEASGNTHVKILATTSLGRMQEFDNQLDLAAASYRHVVQMVGDPPGPVACEAYAGLARISYERNDLATAEQYGQLSLTLARQIEISSFVTSEVLLARLRIARGDLPGATAMLAATEQDVRQRKFGLRLLEVVTVRVRAALLQGNLAEAADLVQMHDLPLCLARVQLAQADPAAALATLDQARQHFEAIGWQAERLEAIVLQALAHHALGAREMALQRLAEALALTEASGFIRTFVDEGVPMTRVLADAATEGIRPDYVHQLLAAFDADGPSSDDHAALPARPQPLIEPLSQRELEVLRLIADGLSNRQIAERLFLALNTVKGHNRVIFGKLQVERRTEAVARARELGLL